MNRFGVPSRKPQVGSFIRIIPFLIPCLSHQQVCWGTFWETKSNANIGVSLGNQKDKGDPSFGSVCFVTFVAGLFGFPHFASQESALSNLAETRLLS